MNPCLGFGQLLAIVLFAFVCAPSHAAPRWELKLGVDGKHNDDGWKIAAPELEIKYQWSDSVELEAKVSRVIVDPDNGPATSGLGAGRFGVDWRVIDKGSAGFDMAVVSKVGRYLSRSSVRKGVISANKELALGLKSEVVIRGVELEIETMRKLIENKPDVWEMEVKAEYSCLKSAACVVSAAREFAHRATDQTMVKLGLKWKLSQALNLKTMVGREFGPDSRGRKDRALSAELEFAY